MRNILNLSAIMARGNRQYKDEVRKAEPILITALGSAAMNLCDLREQGRIFPRFDGNFCGIMSGYFSIIKRLLLVLKI